MDRLRALQDQARAAGGAVHVLLGNHETMNLLRLYRDVNPAAYAEFAGPGSEERRRQALERSRDRAAAGELDEAAWLEAHPPGWLEYAESLGPEGEYGRWLRSLPASVRVGDTVFVHGGFSDEVDLGSPDDLNRALSEEIGRFDDARRHLIREGVLLPELDFPQIELAVAEEIGRFVPGGRRARLRSGTSRRSELQRERHRQALLAMAESGRGWALRTDSPLWFRGFASWSAEEGAPRVAALLQRFGARRFVAGHSVVQPAGSIRQRFDGRVFLIDTGMLESVYGGRPSALVIEGGLVRSLYPGGEEEVLWGDVPAADVAAKLLGRARWWRNASCPEASHVRCAWCSRRWTGACGRSSATASTSGRRYVCTTGAWCRSCATTGGTRWPRSAGRGSSVSRT